MFRGAAHNNFNLGYQVKRTVPVILHNLSGYDAFFIVKELATGIEGPISLLPINKERYISFTKHVDGSGMKLKFIDSFRFMNSSLSELASLLSPDAMMNLKLEFSEFNANQLELLTRKGVFPYDYVDSLNKLEDSILPPKTMFYNELNDSGISDEDYEHAQKVWQEFSIKSLGEYSDLYLKVDVMLLVDIFENFRSNCAKIYSLEPAHYCSLPGYTWDCMLLHTKVRLELLTNVDMLLFFERGLRGGVSQCSNRYSKANNKFLPDFDATKDTTYLMYFDVNNLYGWAMSQYLPSDNFQWMTEINYFDVMYVSDRSHVGYVLEVDLEYPESIHTTHQDLPFCSEHCIPPGGKYPKLITSLHNKKRYVIHYRNLKQCLSNGLILTKIYRILKFNQSPWLKSYIDMNSSLRANAANEFEKNLYKLMNNAVFGKSMENVRKHVNVKLVTKWHGRFGAKALIAKPNFHSRSILDENVVAIELRKLEVKFNKPMYVGMVILDVSKVCLYNFHYSFMLNKFKSNCKLMYTDTDSLIYEIKCNNIYDEMKDNIEMFDTSDYESENVHGMPRVNKKVVGLMKDENKGKIMYEFVGLRSKLYSFRTLDKKDVKKAKGVKSNVVHNVIQFDDYLKCLNKKIILEKSQNTIKSKLHNVFSIHQTKTALSPYDDKRYVQEHSTDTLPWGHVNIPSPLVIPTMRRKKKMNEPLSEAGCSNNKQCKNIEKKKSS